MKNIGRHIVEYYQNGKFLGYITTDGELMPNEIGYSNQTRITSGFIKTKKIHTATVSSPIIVIKYNMQGR